MRKFNVHPLARSIGIFGAVAALATGVTFAALNSSATLTNSSITTGTTDLEVFNFNTADWSDKAPGFTITNLVPGTGSNYSFYVRNTGTANYNVSAHVPILPGPPVEGSYGFSGFENVTLHIYGEGCNVAIDTTLAALNSSQVALPCVLNGGAAGDSTSSGHAGNYDVHVDINPAAITGDHAGVGLFDIVLTGNQAGL